MIIICDSLIHPVVRNHVVFKLCSNDTPAAGLDCCGNNGLVVLNGRLTQTKLADVL